MGPKGSLDRVDLATPPGHVDSQNPTVEALAANTEGTPVCLTRSVRIGRSGKTKDEGHGGEEGDHGLKDHARPIEHTCHPRVQAPSRKASQARSLFAVNGSLVPINKPPACHLYQWPQASTQFTVNLFGHCTSSATSRGDYGYQGDAGSAGHGGDRAPRGVPDVDVHQGADAGDLDCPAVAGRQGNHAFAPARYSWEKRFFPFTRACLIWYGVTPMSPASAESGSSP